MRVFCSKCAFISACVCVFCSVCFALNGGGGGGDFSQLLALIHAIFEEVLQVPDLLKPRMKPSRRFLHHLQSREEKLTLENRRQVANHLLGLMSRPLALTR